MSGGKRVGKRLLRARRKQDREAMGNMPSPRREACPETSGTVTAGRMGNVCPPKGDTFPRPVRRRSGSGRTEEVSSPEPRHSRTSVRRRREPFVQRVLVASLIGGAASYAVDRGPAGRRCRCRAPLMSIRMPPTRIRSTSSVGADVRKMCEKPAVPVGC